MSETGQLREDSALVYEAAVRVFDSGGDLGAGGARRTLIDGGLEVTRAGGDRYEVRLEGLLVFRCRGGEPPEVFEPGEWMVRLVQAGQPATPDESAPPDAGPPRGE
jgi:hypothetical protein